jgi:hypothetical protein
VKSLGFESLAELQTFMDALAAAVDATDYDLDAVAAMLSAIDPPFEGSDDGLTPAALEAYADAWVRDVEAFSTLDHWRDAQAGRRTRFRLRTREFRQEREWLRGDLRDDEYFTYRHPTEGTVLYYGLRRAPPEAPDAEELLFAGNMEGVAVEVSPESLAADAATDANAPSIPTDGWDVALISPGAEERAGGADGSAPAATLDNAEAVVWRREP